VFTTGAKGYRTIRGKKDKTQHIQPNTEKNTICIHHNY
jgi:hypothetical protein